MFTKLNNIFCFSHIKKAFQLIFHSILISAFCDFTEKKTVRTLFFSFFEVGSVLSPRSHLFLINVRFAQVQRHKLLLNSFS